VLRAPSAGKLLNFLVADGARVSASKCGEVVEIALKNAFKRKRSAVKSGEIEELVFSVSHNFLLLSP